MKSRLLTLYAILIGLLIVACAPNKVTPPVIDDNPPPVDVETEQEEPTSMLDFFPSEDVTIHYKGEGNEFAELDVEIRHIDDQYVVRRENNGGSYIQTVYKINEKNIEIIHEKHIDFEEAYPTADDLKELPALGIYLQQPFAEGATFDNWTIIDLDAVVETPYQTFDKAIIIEMHEDDFIDRKYFVRTIGEVKRESIMMTEGEEDFIVTSTLQSISE